MTRHERRDLDLVVWGATGYTGRLVADALAAGAPAGLRWALGGRDRERLEALRSDLAADVEIVCGDAHDAASLARIARATRVVLSTVGPYSEHGTPLVSACVEAGTDYADISGETRWMRSSIDAFDASARASGARIVHACGFDAVPSDLGVWLLQEAALARYERPCRRCVHVFGVSGAGLSGGSVASTLGVLTGVANERSTRLPIADVDLLAPGAPPSSPITDVWWPQREPQRRAWTAPFPMALVNTRVVRRTRALLGEPWSSAFEYRERWRAPSWSLAALVGAGSRTLPALLALSPARRLAQRWLPKPGEGPEPAALERGSFDTTLTGQVDGVAEPVVVRIASPFDPGYRATARMLREIGLLLAAGECEAPGGVLTPAFVGRERLVERLGLAGIRFEVVAEPVTPADQRPADGGA